MEEIDGRALRAEVSALVAAVGERTAERILELERQMELDRLLDAIGIARHLPITRKRRLVKVLLMKATGSRWWPQVVHVVDAMRSRITDWGGSRAADLRDYEVLCDLVIGPPPPDEPPTPIVIELIEQPDEQDEPEEQAVETKFDPWTIQPDTDGVFRNLTLDQIEELHRVGRLVRNPSPSEDSRFWPKGE